MKKKKKNYNNYKKRIQRKWKAFLTGLKKIFLVTGVIFCLSLCIQAFMPIYSKGDSAVSKDKGNLSELHSLDGSIDGIKDFVEELQKMLDEIFRLIRAVDQTFSDDISSNIQLENIPGYTGEPYVILNKNIPSFTKEEMKTESYEFYAELDLLGRCGVTEACIGKDLMPTEERGAIGMVKPSGWKLKKYDIVEGKYIYNRCHLIGYQLTGENANVKNLITGTRYMNVEGMLPFENQVADYIRRTGNHVMYRVTPIFEGNNLVASGVRMEAYSVEDRGAGICFHVYVYNVQPGIMIDYETGDNWLADE